MKTIKKIMALGCAMVISVSAMSTVVNADATNWGLYHFQGAPTSDYQTQQTIYLFPEYTGRVGGYCSSYSLNSGEVSVSPILYLPNESTGILDIIPLEKTKITGIGGCDIRDRRIIPMSNLSITLAFTNQNAYGYAYGRY